MAKDTKNQTLALYRRMRANKAASDRDKLEQAVKAVIPAAQPDKGTKGAKGANKTTVEEVRNPTPPDGGNPPKDDGHQPPDGDA